MINRSMNNDPIITSNIKWCGNEKPQVELKSTIELSLIEKNKGSPSRRDVNCEIRFLDKSYLEDIILLQDKIGHSLPDPTIFRLHSIDFFRDL